MIGRDGGMLVCGRGDGRGDDDNISTILRGFLRSIGFGGIARFVLVQFRHFFVVVVQLVNKKEGRRNRGGRGEEDAKKVREIELVLLTLMRFLRFTVLLFFT